jgi:23S rRNA pseudouridine1911/1915/1917 synthase
MPDAPERLPDHTPDPRILSLSAASEGVRLDVFLAAELSLSRGQARRLIERGAVSLAGRRLSLADKGMVLSGAGQLAVDAYAAPGDQRALPGPPGVASPTLVARGTGWIAVDKPAGMPVHPLREEETGTVLGQMLALDPEIHGVGEGGLRSGVVHRLDVDTSGVMLLATQKDAWERLRGAFQAHRVRKRYRAIVQGDFAPAGGVLQLELALVVARHRPARVRVARPDEARRGRARIIVQTVRPVEVLRGATLIEIEPRTGFLHQIRASMAHLGHPLLGDARYGGPVAPDPTAGDASRHMLHAAEIGLEEIHAGAPDPPDLLACLEELR